MRALLYPAPASGLGLWALIFVFVAVLWLVGCTIPSGYVVADRMTYDAIADEHRAYVQGDPLLTKAKRQRRLDLVDSWDARLLEAESDEAEGIAPVETEDVTGSSPPEISAGGSVMGRSE